MSYDPQYQQQAYPQQGYGPPPSQKTNTFAILALVFAFVFSPLGIVFGIMGRKQIDQTGEGGRGLATAGLILGIIFVVLTVLYLIAVVALFGSAVNEFETTTY